jgi:hypothetical protein
VDRVFNPIVHGLGGGDRTVSRVTWWHEGACGQHVGQPQKWVPFA